MLKAGAGLVSFDLPQGLNSISRKQNLAVLKNTLNIFISVLKRGTKEAHSGPGLKLSVKLMSNPLEIKSAWGRMKKAQC